MFPRKLYKDNQVSFYKDWFGIGAFFVISERGKRKASKNQSIVILHTIDAFIKSGQRLDPSNQRCRDMFEYFAHRLCGHETDLTWRTLYMANFEELGKSFAKGEL